MHAFFKRHDIQLRKLEASDLPDLLALKKETWSETHRVALLNSTDQQKWFEQLDTNPHSPSVIIMVGEVSRTAMEKILEKTHSALAMAANLASIGYDATSIGIFKINNIDWVNRSADVGWDIYDAWRGMGFGQLIVKAGCDFCFSILNLRRLNAEVLATNIPSRKCALRAGFVSEGHKREAVFKDGEFINSEVFGMLKLDFDAVNIPVTPITVSYIDLPT